MTVVALVALVAVVAVAALQKYPVVAVAVVVTAAEVAVAAVTCVYPIINRCWLACTSAPAFISGLGLGWVEFLKDKDRCLVRLS